MNQLTRELIQEIDLTTQDVFDLATREAAKRKEGSRRNAYVKGIRTVRDTAGTDAARDLADWIQEEIRSTEQFPSSRRVRQKGAAICREHGHEVSTGSWLGA